jgi:hypothetical protein
MTYKVYYVNKRPVNALLGGVPKNVEGQHFGTATGTANNLVRSPSIW